jgi:hypothetical protein
MTAAVPTRCFIGHDNRYGKSRIASVLHTSAMSADRCQRTGAV